MKQLIWAVALATLCSQFALADGTPRFAEEGNVKVRFYYDENFKDNHLSKFSNLQADMLAGLQFTGKYRIGVKFSLDTTAYNNTVDMGSDNLWSWAEMETFMNKSVAREAGIVKILFHARGFTQFGNCLFDDSNGQQYSHTEGLTWPRAIGPNGVASAQISVTAKEGCTQRSFTLKSQGSIKNTFVHEVMHAMGHPGFDNPHKSCSTAPQAAITCHSVKPGLIKHWQRWFTADIEVVRRDLFDNQRPLYPAVACYEWSSRQACDTNCVNGAGFPSIGATEVYNACIAQYCNKMCK